MLKSRIIKLTVAAATITTVLGLTGAGVGSASAAIPAHSAATRTASVSAIPDNLAFTCNAITVPQACVWVFGNGTAASAPGDPLTPALREAEGCNQRICFKAYWEAQYLYAYAWLRFSGDSFDGHYQLINPRNNGFNSGPNQIYHHSPAFRYPEKFKIVGKWCLIGWRYNPKLPPVGHNYNKIGEPCVTVIGS